MDSRLAGKVALVFGAGSSGEGLSNGKAAALAFARAGAKVAAIDMNSDEAARTAKEISNEGGAALALEADVTVEEQVATVIAEAATRLGAPTVLHNNVGVAHLGSVVELDLRAWNAAFAVNVTGVFLTCKHTLPHMLSAGGGSIINVSSLASIREIGYIYPSYSAAKAAVNQLTVSLALEYAHHGIRANAILPGLIDTPMVRKQIVAGAPEVQAALNERDTASPTGRMGSPWDVAAAAVFLASNDAAYINGVCLPVDGGLAVRCA